MPFTCVRVTSTQGEALLPILHDAEEDDERIRTELRDPACATYAAYGDRMLVGAAVVR